MTSRHNFENFSVVKLFTKIFSDLYVLLFVFLFSLLLWTITHNYGIFYLNLLCDSELSLCSLHLLEVHQSSSETLRILVCFNCLLYCIKIKTYKYWKFWTKTKNRRGILTINKTQPYLCLYDRYRIRLYNVQQCLFDPGFPSAKQHMSRSGDHPKARFSVFFSEASFVDIL